MFHRFGTGRRLSALALLAVLAAAPAARAEPTPVTAWTDEADSLGEGNANWHSLAIMHAAMHDALNAAHPVYARWAPPAPDEPQAAGASPQAAMETAAATVLAALHPDHAPAIEEFLSARLLTLPPGPALDGGEALGRAVGRAAVARRRDDGFRPAYLFPGSGKPGVWRPTPPDHRSSYTTRTRPFLFDSRDGAGGEPPPEPGSSRYLSDVATTRRLGGAAPGDRTPDQTQAAIYWAYQSTQRGYVHLAASLIDASPARFDLPAQARIMSQLTAAMADSAILIWAAKERWSFWRPVDAINSGQFGVAPDESWSSFIETPPHPEYPSGHASDCYTGAAFITAALMPPAPLTYTAQSAPSTPGRPSEVWSSDMGLPAPPIELLPTPRRFATAAEAAQDCADSRIWAGAHFPSANEESRRIAGLVAARALAAVPPLPR